MATAAAGHAKPQRTHEEHIQHHIGHAAGHSDPQSKAGTAAVTKRTWNTVCKNSAGEKHKSTCV